MENLYQRIILSLFFCHANIFELYLNIQLFLCSDLDYFSVNRSFSSEFFQYWLTLCLLSGRRFFLFNQINLLGKVFVEFH